MNANMGEGNDNTNSPGSTNNLICRILGEILARDRNWVFIEEHPDSINDGCFLVDVENFQWLDLPTSYHS